jgi:hypothetical protein
MSPKWNYKVRRLQARCSCHYCTTELLLLLRLTLFYVGFLDYFIVSFMFIINLLIHF